MFLKISQYSQENNCVAVSESLLIKLQTLRPATLLKDTPTHFPVNIEKFFKNSFSYRATLVAASGIEKFCLFAIYATLKIYQDS